ncbi:hypothetical protein MAIC_47870 [Mycolicibacterium aichiense]|uniref:Secreted protein n=2 Tax=Mycolicibacterium aichiense TaxID=1799 RepID=A0AAD1HS58_9MYCO|nr:hypothetical protein MAIC_47870 [Mycolicibacterium aichiense]STZ26353.1 Uncharacterised protein [Mycolicibacterium aichiense]
MMLSRILIGLVSVAGAAAIGTPGMAAADPEPAPAPVLPNVNAYTPVSPVPYTAMGGNWYAFAGPPGVVCVLDKQNSSYGCSGALPGAPNGANLVSAGPSGEPGFSSSGASLYAAAGDVKPLPPNTRLSFRDISCGVDGGGVVACVNNHDQVGFVVGPGATFTSGPSPMLDRPKNSNPLFPSFPG